MISADVAVLATLLAVLAGLFVAGRHPIGAKVFKIVPLLVFAYFVPTILSNTGVIPTKAPLYDFIKWNLLPASLALLTVSVDVKAIFSLGRPALMMFLAATASIVIGGPLAYLALGWMIPPELGDQAWKGLAALSGSWIGGGANFTAIGESVGVDESTYGMMVVVDVAIASVWMAFLLGFANRQDEMDRKVGADRSGLDDLRVRIEQFQAEVARPTTLPDLLLIATIGIGTAVVANALAAQLPPIGNIINTFTWTVIIATTAGLALSFTPLRRLEGAGASAVGSVFLFLLIASIGAKANLASVFEAPGLMAIGAVWMAFHALMILLAWKWLRVPIFFAAVGSQANVGGAASAPIVAHAFHPALAPVGVLLAVAGYVLGTYAALVCAFLLEQIHRLVY